MLAPISQGRDVGAAVTAECRPAPENRGTRDEVCHGGERTSRHAGRGPARCGMDSKTFYSDDASDALAPLSLRPREAAERLGISVSTLERLTKAGEIPRVKFGNTVLYTVESLTKWLKSRETYMEGGAA